VTDKTWLHTWQFQHKSISNDALNLVVLYAFSAFNDSYEFIGRLTGLLPEMNEERGPSFSGLDSLVFFL